MKSIKSLATFFGWCTIINFGILLFGVLVWMLVNEFTGLTASMVGLTPQDVNVAFLNGIMVYRAGIVLFNLVPYIALKIMDRAQVDVRN